MLLDTPLLFEYRKGQTKMLLQKHNTHRKPLKLQVIPSFHQLQQRIVLPHKITQQITGTYTEPGAPSSSSFGECHTGCWFLPLMTLSLGKGKCLTVCSSSSSFLLLSTSKIHLITPKHKQGLWVATSKGRKEEWFTVSLFPNERWHKP